VLAAGGTGFWQTLLIGCIAPALGLIAWTITWWRKRGAERREVDRREDTLWGFTDGQGRYHTGVIDSYGDQIKNLRLDTDEIHDILERNGLR